MKWWAWAGLSLVLLIVVVVGVGAALPREHVARTRAHIKAPRAEVWQALTDVAAFPQWRTAVSEVELLTGAAGETMWRERSRQGVMTFQQVEAVAPHRLVTRIADTDLGFGGSWTYELADVDGITRVTITENGYVSNPLFRFMSRFVFGHYGAQESLMRSLAGKFGHDVEPERIS